MRSAILFAAQLAAMSLAQTTQTTGGPILETVLVPSGSVTVKSVFTYSNPETSVLTETNSNGVVTGQLTAMTSQPAAVTTQPALPPGVTTEPVLATIPAGLPSGVNTVYLNISSSLTSFLVSVGSSTTDVVGGALPTSVSLTTGVSPGVDVSSVPVSGMPTKKSGKGGKVTGSPSAQAASMSSGAPKSSSTPNAAVPGIVNAASAGLLGLGGVLAALL